MPKKRRHKNELVCRCFSIRLLRVVSRKNSIVVRREKDKRSAGTGIRGTKSVCLHTVVVVKALVADKVARKVATLNFIFN